MPRTRLDDSGGNCRKLRVLINGTTEIEKKDIGDIGQILDMCETSTRKYLREPERLPLDKLLKLGRSLHIPISDLRDAIQY